MKRNVTTWVYRSSTGVAAIGLTVSGAADVLRVPGIVEGLAHLGYPAYLATLLGICKLLAVVALVAPRHPRVKEWAYAGLFFELTGGAKSHAASGDPVANTLPPVFLPGRDDVMRIPASA